MLRAFATRNLEFCTSLPQADFEHARGRTCPTHTLSMSGIWRVWGPGNGLGQTAQTKQIVHIHDVVEGPAYANGDPGRVATVDLGGVRTALIVPLLKEGKLLPRSLRDLSAGGSALYPQADRGTYFQHYPFFFRRVLPEDTLISMVSRTEEPYFSISVFTYLPPEQRQPYYVFCDWLRARDEQVVRRPAALGQAFAFECGRNCASLSRLRTI